MSDEHENVNHKTKLNMRECWNWQTGTFEVRVSTTYGFKSRLAHHENPEGIKLSGFFVFTKSLRKVHFLKQSFKGFCLELSNEDWYNLKAWLMTAENLLKNL